MREGKTEGKQEDVTRRQDVQNVKQLQYQQVDNTTEMIPSIHVQEEK